MDDARLEIARLGLAKAAIGVEMDNFYFSARAYQCLTESLPGATFVDATGLPGAYRVGGVYRVDGDELELQAKLFLGREKRSEFSLSGSRHEFEAFAGRVATEIHERVLRDAEEDG